MSIWRPFVVEEDKKPFWSSAVIKLENLVASIPQGSTSDQESTWRCYTPRPVEDTSPRFHVSPNTAFSPPPSRLQPVLPENSTTDPDLHYAAFRATMLEAVKLRNGGSLTVSNPNMRRSFYSNVKVADSRRAKNAAAAKRSRDAKKLREDELAIRAKYLERVNADLQVNINAVKMARQNGRCFTCWSPY